MTVARKNALASLYISVSSITINGAKGNQLSWLKEITVRGHRQAKRSCLSVAFTFFNADASPRII